MHRELAHAKINLSLRVLAREASGFHQIETIFCALELADEIDIAVTGDGVGLSVSAHSEQIGEPMDLGPVDENLAHRAAVLFCARAGVSGVQLSLTKRIPHGAGLGGGSSDAAAVLRGLDALHDHVLGTDELMSIGAALGSDVPFFLADSPLALAWGRGSRMLQLPPLPPAPVLIVMPGERMSTAEAYRALAAERTADYVAQPGVLRTEGITWDDVARESVNDFEPVTFGKIGKLRGLHDALQESGAVLARMTGTGSALFGIYRDADAAQRAHSQIAAEYTGVDLWLTRTR